MRKIVTLLLMVSLALSLTLLTSCARQPSLKSSHSMMTNYFKKYAKKYPDSIIGKNPVSNVGILHIEEIHKDLVAVYAIADLQSGAKVQVRFNILNKMPFGWRAISWENMGVLQQ